MELETVLLAAVQSSFILGLIHGINPCGHSWLVLAPFVVGEKRGRKVFILTSSFVGGTVLACLALGLTLGAVSSYIPSSAAFWVENLTSVALGIIGIVLMVNPHLLHNHDHDHHHNGHDHHHHDHNHVHHHGHHHGDLINHPHVSPNEGDTCCAQQGKQGLMRKMIHNGYSLPLVLFVVGFVNMIIPCPTALVMYGYAINAATPLAATIVFGAYAVSTAIAVGGVIYLIFRTATMLSSMQKEWIEPLIMRSAGFIILLFSMYAIYHSFME